MAYWEPLLCYFSFDYLECDFLEQLSPIDFELNLWMKNGFLGQLMTDIGWVLSDFLAEVKLHNALHCCFLIQFR